MIGIDEVGRGCWAGPLLVVAARRIGPLPVGLADSKKLSAQKRESLIPAIEQSCQLGQGWVKPSEIDQLGLTQSMYLAVERALQDIHPHANEQIIMDGTINYCNDSYSSVVCQPRADSLYPLVSAASIYAKVLRDNFMKKIAEEYPEYGFDRHVGYGTVQHIQALTEHGVSNQHRLSYRPVKAFMFD